MLRDSQITVWSQILRPTYNTPLQPVLAPQTFLWVDSSTSVEVGVKRAVIVLHDILKKKKKKKKTYQV